MSNLGLDHPLIAVRDLDAAQATYLSLGFKMKPAGRHPWGTSTALVIFPRQLIELVSIYDASLLDSYPAGQFSFGRHVEAHLRAGEGVALSAVCSEDAAGDAAEIEARGAVCAGTIEFGRDVIRADGQADRTATTLKVFPNAALPRLSIFACQQHRRDLVEFPEWMDHPNGALGFASATILAEREDQPAVQTWLEAIHGGAAREMPWGFVVQTARGAWRVMCREGARAVFGTVPVTRHVAADVAVISLDIRVRCLAALLPFIEAGAFAYREIDGTLVLTEQERLGGIFLSFQED